MTVKEWKDALSSHNKYHEALTDMVEGEHYDDEELCASTVLNIIVRWNGGLATGGEFLTLFATINRIQNIDITKY